MNVMLIASTYSPPSGFAKSIACRLRHRDMVTLQVVGVNAPNQSLEIIRLANENLGEDCLGLVFTPQSVSPVSDDRPSDTVLFCIYRADLVPAPSASDTPYTSQD